MDQDMSKFPTIFWWAPEMFEQITKALPFLKEFDSYETILHIVRIINYSSYTFSHRIE